MAKAKMLKKVVCYYKGGVYEGGSYDEVFVKLKLDSLIHGRDISEHADMMRKRLKLMYGIRTEAKTSKGVLKAMERADLVKIEEVY